MRNLRAAGTALIASTAATGIAGIATYPIHGTAGDTAWIGTTAAMVIAAGTATGRRTARRRQICTHGEPESEPCPICGWSPTP